MLFVTLHGNKPGEDSRRKTSMPTTKDGNKITSSVLDENPDVILTELRGLYLVGAYLYVATRTRPKTASSAMKDRTQYKFVGEFASKKKTCSGTCIPSISLLMASVIANLSSQDTT